MLHGFFLTRDADSRCGAGIRHSDRLRSHLFHETLGDFEDFARVVVWRKARLVRRAFRRVKAFRVTLTTSSGDPSAQSAFPFQIPLRC